jgi:hypothetical protein
MTTKNVSADVRKPKRDGATLAILGAMFIALALVCGASLTAFGSGAVDEVMHALGYSRVSVLESEQRRQAAVLAALEPLVRDMASEVGSLNRRITSVHHDDTSVNDRLALVDADIAALVAETKSLRSAQHETGQSLQTARSELWREPVSQWREPVEHLDVAISATRSDVLALRSTLDDRDQVYRKDIGSILRRLDRLEQARDLTSSIRVSTRVAPRKKVVKRKHRARPATIAQSPWNDPQVAFAPPKTRLSPGPAVQAE